VRSQNVLEKGDCVQKAATDSVIDVEMLPLTKVNPKASGSLMMVIISLFGTISYGGWSILGGKKREKSISMARER
jgi:hypothetical protein